MELQGRFAIYRGQEYRASKDGQCIVLYSKDKSAEKIGFSMNPTGTAYVLNVPIDEIERYYKKKTVGYYVKDTFEIVDEDEETYTLYSSIKNYPMSELGFTEIGKWEYEKTVNKRDVKNVRAEYKDLL